MSKEPKKVISVDSFEHKLLIKAMYEYRNALLREGKPTEDICELTLKVIDAPSKKVMSYEAR